MIAQVRSVIDAELAASQRLVTLACRALTDGTGVITGGGTLDGQDDPVLELELNGYMWHAV